MSYAPLLRSLASTPRGDWRLVAGTLLRQGFNEGLLSAGAGVVATSKPGRQQALESQRAEARRTGLTLYQVRVARGASTGKGPNVHPRTSGLSATRFVRDLRSVGWGGSERAVRQCYRIMTEQFGLSADPVVRQTNLDSFKARPPRSWVSLHPRNNRDRYIGYARLVSAVRSSNEPENFSSSSDLRQSREERSLQSVLSTLDDIWTAANSHAPAEIEEEYPWIYDLETLEFAGVRHITRGTVRRRKT